MAHVETKDPFGFVGSHVVRKHPRKGGEEHGWLTRYDETLDCYTLFVPGKGEPRLLARGEVMKFLSAPNIELHDDDHDVFPPPVKDTNTSRYLGVKLRRPRHSSSEDEGHIDEDIRGQVTCFLPFGDRYCVEYEDGSTDEVSESAVIDGMIALIKSPFFSSPSRQKASNISIRTRTRMVNLDEDVVSVRRKRQRVEAFSDKKVHEILSGSTSVVENVASPQDDDEVIIVDQTKVETEPAPSLLEISNSALITPHENSLESASHPEVEHLLVDGGEVADLDDDVVVDVSGIPKDSASNEFISHMVQLRAGKQKPVPFYVIERNLHEAVEPLPRRAMAFELLRSSLLHLLDRPEATRVKIAMQYDLLGNPDLRDRDAVLRFMQADGLLVLNCLLNSYATEVIEDTKMLSEDEYSEKICELMGRDNELLHVLKVVAMLPTPSRDQVIASNIGKTINYLSKTHGPPGRYSVLPQCINGLARWIKKSWIKNIPSAKQQSSKTPSNTRQLAYRPHLKARRGGRVGSSGRPGIQLNRRQPPPLQRPQRPVWSTPRMLLEKEYTPNNSTSIPKASRKRQIPPIQQSEIASTSASALAPAPLQPPGPHRVTGGLKPDWMRHKENLSRSRFCIDENTNVDTRLYRDSQAHPTTNMPVVAAAATQQQNTTSDQHEDAGGPDGVFGRAQRLRFGKRWKIQVYGIKDPPGILTQPPKSPYSMSSYNRPQYLDQHESLKVPPVPYSFRQPRSILRRVSRYKVEPAIDG